MNPAPRSINVPLSHRPTEAPFYRRTVRRLLSIALLATTAWSQARAQRPAPGAPIDLAAFRYARDIPAGMGLTTVTLDAAAMSHGRLDDIRIVDGSRRQIPYVIERADSSLVLTLPALTPVEPATNIDRRLPRDAERRTWYRADLPFIGIPDGMLLLETTARVFRREVTVVEGAALDATYRAVTTDSWAHEDPSTAASPLQISLPSRLRSDSLFVLINDGDNEKLPITRATLRLPTYTLRFYRDSAEALRLVYGRADLQRPRYDLELRAEQLRDSAATDVVPGPERAVDDATRGVPSVVFWAILVGTVLILLLLIARLVRGGDEEKPVAGSESPEVPGPAVSS